MTTPPPALSNSRQNSQPATGTTAGPAELAEDYLGNVSESADIARRVMQFQREGRCLEVEIAKGDRAKGRILTQTLSGRAVGIVKGRDWLLRDGDVLSTAKCNLVLVSLRQHQVMALRIEDGANNPAIALLHLGHAVGNQHWPVTARGETLYVELVAEAAQMETTLRKLADTLAIKGLKISFETPSIKNNLDFSVGHAH